MNMLLSPSYVAIWLGFFPIYVCGSNPESDIQKANTMDTDVQAEQVQKYKFLNVIKRFFVGNVIVKAKTKNEKTIPVSKISESKQVDEAIVTDKKTTANDKKSPESIQKTEISSEDTKAAEEYQSVEESNNTVTDDKKVAIDDEKTDVTVEKAATDEATEEVKVEDEKKDITIDLNEQLSGRNVARIAVPGIKFVFPEPTDMSYYTKHKDISKGIELSQVPMCIRNSELLFKQKENENNSDEHDKTTNDKDVNIDTSLTDITIDKNKFDDSEDKTKASSDFLCSDKPKAYSADTENIFYDRNSYEETVISINDANEAVLCDIEPFNLLATTILTLKSIKKLMDEASYLVYKGVELTYEKDKPRNLEQLNFIYFSQKTGNTLILQQRKYNGQFKIALIDPDGKMEPSDMDTSTSDKIETKITKMYAKVTTKQIIAIYENIKKKTLFNIILFEKTKKRDMKENEVDQNLVWIKILQKFVDHQDEIIKMLTVLLESEEKSVASEAMNNETHA